MNIVCDIYIYLASADIFFYIIHFVFLINYNLVLFL